MAGNDVPSCDLDLDLDRQGVWNLIYLDFIGVAVSPDFLWCKDHCLLLSMLYIGMG